MLPNLIGVTTDDLVESRRQLETAESLARSMEFGKAHDILLHLKCIQTAEVRSRIMDLRTHLTDFNFKTFRRKIQELRSDVGATLNRRT